MLGTSHGGRDFSIYMRAAALVEQVYAKNPQHPGAAHYLIHAYDDPVHAPLGLRYADAYSKIAPAASHALHMPSHIYVAMGMWDESAAINERSVKAADARRDAKKLDVDQRGFHALLWLVYTYAQQGRYEDGARRAGADGSGREGKRLGAHPQPPRAGARGVADRDPQVGRGEGAGGVEGPAEGRGDRGAVRDRLRGGAIRQSRRRRQRDAADGGVDGRSAGQRRAGAQQRRRRPRRPGVAPIAPGPVAVAPPGTRPIAPQAPRHLGTPGAQRRHGTAHGTARRAAIRAWRR